MKAPILVLALAMTGVLAAAPARAQDVGEESDATTAETRAHHRRGLELYDEGDYRLALVEFERAYEISKSYKVLFNIAQVHYQLTSYAKARRAFERYLAEGGDQISEARRREVERELDTLRGRTATLTVRVNVSDAEITINEAPIGRAPLEAAVVDAGNLRIRVTRAGFDGTVREIALTGGDVQTVTIELTAHKTPDIVVHQTTTGIPAPAVVAWVVTGVLAAGTVGVAIATNAEANDYDRQREAPISGSPGEARADLERQRDLVSGLALTTDVLAVSTIVAGGLALWFTLREPSRDAPKIKSALGGFRLEARF